MANPIVSITEAAGWTGAPWTRLTLPGDPPPRTPDDANRALVADLIEAIEQNREPRAGGREALWTVEMALAVYESQLTGGRAYFPLKSRAHPLAA